MTAYWYKCPHCGRYEVDRQTMEAHVSPELMGQMGERPDSEDWEAEADFKDVCPRCQDQTHPQVLYIKFQVRQIK